MKYKVSFFKKPPRGMSLKEDANGYTFHINSVDWNFFPLWLILVGLIGLLVWSGIANGLSFLFLPAAILFYFAYLLTTFVFIKAKLVLVKSVFQLYTFKNMLLGQSPYEIELSYIRSIRMGSMVSNSSRTWKQTGSSYIEFTGHEDRYHDAVTIYTKEYTVFISQFLKEYMKTVELNPGYKVPENHF